MSFAVFQMERWQSTYEHQVGVNLSESGVEPLTLSELLEMAGLDAGALASTPLEYNPSNGTPELRERVAALHPGASAANVLVTNGGAEANYITAWYLLGPGDEVVFMAPNYMQLGGLAENLGAAVREWWLQEDSGWEPDLDALQELVGPRTRAIVVTHPNNPTGAVFPEAALEAIVAAAERAGAWIVADEIYRGAEMEGVETPSFWGRYPRLLVTGGLSKAYGLPGLRIGWVVGPAETVAELWARKDYTTIAPGTLNDRLATAALQPTVREVLLRRTRKILATNWPVLEEWLQARADAFSWVPPRAGAIAYVRYHLQVDSLELAERLRVEADCLVVPGAHFRMGSYLRLGFGPRVPQLRAGLQRCAAVIDPLMAPGRRSAR